MGILSVFLRRHFIVLAEQTVEILGLQSDLVTDFINVHAL